MSAFTTVRVLGTGPPPTLDVSAQVRIEQTAPRFEALTGRFVQTVTITNDGATPIPGPLALTLDSLPAEVNWVNHDGVTKNLSPLGADYALLDLANGVALAPGEAARYCVSLETRCWLFFLLLKTSRPKGQRSKPSPLPTRLNSAWQR